MIPDDIKSKIEAKFPKTFVSGGISFDDYHVSSKREAAEFGYQLANETIVKKDARIKELEGVLSGQAYSIWKGCGTDLNFEEWKKQFEHGYNL